MTRILVIRLDAIGDMVLMSPFLRELRRGMPNAHITLLVRPSAYNLVETCPYVNEVAVDYSLSWLWRRRFDVVISPRFDVDHFGANKLLWLSFARQRLIWRNPQRFAEMPRHEVERNLEVLGWLGISAASDHLETWRVPTDEIAAEQLLLRAGSKKGIKLAAIVPGASVPPKQWPVNSFIEVGEWLARESNFQLLVLGSQEEQPLGQQMRAKLGPSVVDITGQTTLREASALLARCQLYIGNDTGLMHLAAAEQVPVVMISRHVRGTDERTRSSPRRFGPWGVSHEIVQPSAGDISHVSVHDVKHAAVALLRRGVSCAHSARDGELGINTGV